MTILVEELITSRETTEQFRDFVPERTNIQVLHIYGSDDPTSGAVLGTIGALGAQLISGGIGVVGLYIVNRKFKVIKISDGITPADASREELAHAGVVECTLTYGPPQKKPPDVNTYDVSFDVGNENVHMEVAPYGQDHYPPGADAVGDAIGVNGGEVAGVDVMRPKAVLSIVCDYDSLPDGFEALITALSYTVNGAAWRGHDAGEVLFMAPKVNHKGRGKYRVEWQFGLAPNVTIPCACWCDGTPSSQSVIKEGWSYLWEERADVVVSGKLTRVVNHVHIAYVYPYGDFSAIPIGTAATDQGTF